MRPRDRWPTVPLGTLGEFRNGVNYNKENFGTGIKVIGVSDFQDHVRASFDHLEQINPEGVVRKEHLLRDGDILFVRSNGNRDLIGRSLFVSGLQENVTHSAFSIRLRFASSQCCPRFYAYLFRSTLIRQALSMYGGGTNISNLNQGILERLEVPLPAMPIQERIASILSAYDDLIENNNRRIKILENMAQMLYREWFVNFRFPDHENVKMVGSELGLIPEGWEVVKVEDVVQRVPSGKKYDQKSVSPKGRTPVFDQGKSGVIGYHDEEPGVIASPNKPIIVFANHTCYQRLVLCPFSSIQNVLPFLPSSSHPRNIYWLHWATKDLIAFNDYKGHWPEFVNKRLLLPVSDLSIAFGDSVKPMVQRQYLLEQANTNLRTTRDLLLPKLISGQVPVDAHAAELVEQTT